MASKSSLKTSQEKPSNKSRDEKLEPNSLKPSNLQVTKTSKPEPTMPKSVHQSANKPTNKGSTENPKALADKLQPKLLKDESKALADKLQPKLLKDETKALADKLQPKLLKDESKALADKLQSKLHIDKSKQLPLDVNSKFGNTYENKKVSGQGVLSPGGTSSIAKSSGSAKMTDLFESGKSSICRGSTSTDISDESSCSSFSSSINKPHKANDSRWEAIQVVRSRDGVLGLSHFRLLKRLGCGDIGSVYLSELSGTKCYFAIKVMDKASLATRKKLLRAQTEREILQCLDHPFLPTLYSNFETDKFSCLVMEFCPGGDLHTLRQRQPGKRFTEQAAKFYVAEVLLAMEYLHMLGIVYRDLKPENVLVREDGHVMLSDFDLSLRCTVSPTLVKSSFDSEASRKNSAYCIEPSCIQPSCVVPTSCFSPRLFSSKSKKEKKPKNETLNQVSPLPELMAEPTSARSMSFVGTHEYLAPEIVKGEGHGSAVDWWTFGIFLYELLFGKTPFKGSGNRATLFNVVGQPLRFPESPLVSFAARDLIRGLLVKEPQNRLAYKRGATEIKQHPFFEGVNWALIRCASPPEIPRPVEIERIPAPLALSGEKAAVVVNPEKKGSDNYLEFDFF